MGPASAFGVVAGRAFCKGAALPTIPAMRNNVKTLVLMATLGGLFVLVGQLSAAPAGAITALVIAGGINFLMYFFSDKIALGLDRGQARRGTRTARRVLHRAGR